MVSGIWCQYMRSVWVQAFDIGTDHEYGNTIRQRYSWWILAQVLSISTDRGYGTGTGHG